ncbi:hypothetical protein H0H87_009674 [Tephrocybe sp. NHM501043]|nr:hypothetical protein H0H87_009674 [Tephrocybe sp. NHM501043]
MESLSSRAHSMRVLFENGRYGDARYDSATLLRNPSIYANVLQDPRVFVFDCAQGRKEHERWLKDPNHHIYVKHLVIVNYDPHDAQSFKYIERVVASSVHLESFIWEFSASPPRNSPDLKGAVDGVFSKLGASLTFLATSYCPQLAALSASCPNLACLRLSHAYRPVDYRDSLSASGQSVHELFFNKLEVVEFDLDSLEALRYILNVRYSIGGWEGVHILGSEVNEEGSRKFLPALEEVAVIARLDPNTHLPNYSHKDLGELIEKLADVSYNGIQRLWLHDFTAAGLPVRTLGSLTHLEAYLRCNDDHTAFSRDLLVLSRTLRNTTEPLGREIPRERKCKVSITMKSKPGDERDIPVTANALLRIEATMDHVNNGKDLAVKWLTEIVVGDDGQYARVEDSVASKVVATYKEKQRGRIPTPGFEIRLELDD